MNDLLSQITFLKSLIERLERTPSITDECIAHVSGSIAMVTRQMVEMEREVTRFEAAKAPRYADPDDSIGDPFALIWEEAA